MKSSEARVRFGDLSNKKVEKEEADEYFGKIFRYGAGLQSMSFTPFDGAQFESGYGAGAHVTMEFSSRYAIEVSYGQYTQKVKTTDKISSGKATIRPLQFSVQYLFNGRRTLTPFFQGGATFYSIGYNRDPGPSGYEPYEVTQKIKDGMGYQFGGGLHYFPSRSRKFDLTLDYRYVMFRADNQLVLTWQGTQYAFSQYSLDMSGHQVNAGCTYYF